MYTLLITIIIAAIATLFKLWLGSKSGKKWLASL